MKPTTIPLMLACVLLGFFLCDKAKEYEMVNTGYSSINQGYETVAQEGVKNCHARLDALLGFGQHDFSLID